MMRTKTTKSWPRVTSLILALIPVGILIYIIAGLASESHFALSRLRPQTIFSTEFSGAYTSGKDIWGLIPPMWGSFLVVVLATAIATPIALAIAVFSSEFTSGRFGRALRGIIGCLSGIPPIVYALMAVVFAGLFFVPKFCAPGIPAENLPPPGMYWWSPTMLPTTNSTLLGSFLIALLVVPFVTPLIDDALRNVPYEVREASFALGANRWHTLARVTLPAALPGILAAVTLGALKALGDVLIVGWAIGFESGLPNPLGDVLESTATLTSAGAGLVGGFSESEQAAIGFRWSIGHFMGLMLLIIALGILVGVSWLQRRFKQRFAA